MKTLLLAFRNLQRNRRRSSTTMLAMVSGLVAVLLFGGYTTDINYGLQSNYVRQSGHLQLQHSNYFLYGSGDPVSYGIDNYEHVIDVLRGDPQLASLVTVITPVLSINGIAGNFSAGVSRTVFGVGMVVADQNRMRTWNDYGFPDRPSQLKLTGSGPDAAVIGTGVARVLRLCDQLDVPHCSGQDAPAPVHAKTAAAAPPDIAALSAIETAAKSKKTGAHIELLASNAYGAPNIAELNVVQAQRQGVKEVDDMFVQLHLPQAQRLVYGGGQPKVTAIELQLHHTDQLPQARARLNALLSSSLRGEPLEVLDFATLNAQYGQITGMFGAVFGFIAVLIATVVMFTVSNTMNMAVMERTNEIGTLRAIGVRRAGIRRMFVYEGFLLGVCGAAVGVLCALGAAALIDHAGLHWVPPGQTEPVALTVRVWGETAMIARYAIGVVLVATFSAWWPARRAARMSIVDSLRFA